MIMFEVLSWRQVMKVLKQLKTRTTSKSYNIAFPSISELIQSYFAKRGKTLNNPKEASDYFCKLVVKGNKGFDKILSMIRQMHKKHNLLDDAVKAFLTTPLLKDGKKPTNVDRNFFGHPSSKYYDKENLPLFFSLFGYALLSNNKILLKGVVKWLPLFSDEEKIKLFSCPIKPNLSLKQFFQDICDVQGELKIIYEEANRLLNFKMQKVEQIESYKDYIQQILLKRDIKKALKEKDLGQLRNFMHDVPDLFVSYIRENYYRWGKDEKIALNSILDCLVKYVRFPETVLQTIAQAKEISKIESNLNSVAINIFVYKFFKKLMLSNFIVERDHLEPSLLHATIFDQNSSAALKILQLMGDLSVVDDSAFIQDFFSRRCKDDFLGFVFSRNINYDVMEKCLSLMECLDRNDFKKIVNNNSLLGEYYSPLYYLLHHYKNCPNKHLKQILDNLVSSDQLEIDSKAISIIVANEKVLAPFIPMLFSREDAVYSFSSEDFETMIVSGSTSLLRRWKDKAKDDKEKLDKFFLKKMKCIGSKGESFFQLAYKAGVSNLDMFYIIKEYLTISSAIPIVLLNHGNDGLSMDELMEQTKILNKDKFKDAYRKRAEGKTLISDVKKEIDTEMGNMIRKAKAGILNKSLSMSVLDGSEDSLKKLREIFG